MVVLDFRSLRWQRVGRKCENVQRPQKDHPRIDVEKTRHEHVAICLEATVDGVSHGDEGPHARHLPVDLAVGI